jgi:hypothetical protein
MFTKVQLKIIAAALDTHIDQVCSDIAVEGYEKAIDELQAIVNNPPNFIFSIAHDGWEHGMKLAIKAEGMNGVVLHDMEKCEVSDLIKRIVNTCKAWAISNERVYEAWKVMDRFKVLNGEFYTIVTHSDTIGVLCESNGAVIVDLTHEYKDVDDYMDRHWGVVEKVT